MRIIVTGSNGRLGRHVSARLDEAGYEVIGVGRTFPTGKSTQLQFRKLDLNIPGNAQIALRGADAVVHLAAIPAPGRHQNGTVFSNNTIVTYNVLEAAYTLGITKIVIASSIAALGYAYAVLYPSRAIPLQYFPIDEEHPLSPIDAYGLSKYVDELTCASFALRANMTIAALRFPWITLPEDYLNTVRDADSCNRMQNIFWSYIDIRDAVQAIEKALYADINGFRAMYVSARNTLCTRSSIDLANTFFPNIKDLRFEVEECQSFFSITCAERLISFVPNHTWQQTLSHASCWSESQEMSYV